ncbi:hypothetical protein LXA43DRAFT_1034483 [Ganoderma leucocontextum]|nr:hypothetical protein LXA43DRAFT_1034483 [Ganoderma leucocontextum]
MSPSSVHLPVRPRESPADPRTIIPFRAEANPRISCGGRSTLDHSSAPLSHSNGHREAATVSLDLTASSSPPLALASSHAAVDMTSLLSPTPIPQYSYPTSLLHPTHKAVLQTLQRRGGDDDGNGNVWPPACTLPPGCLLGICPDLPAACRPPSPSSPYPSTWSLPSGTLPISATTTQTATPSPSPSGSSGTESVTVGDGLTTATLPASSSGFPVVIVSDDRGLSAGELAGVIVGSVCAALLLLLFFWLLRRGTFGSGTLFGCRYGDARKPGWGAGTGMRQRSREGYVVSVSGPFSSDGLTLSDPFLAGTKLPSYSHAPSYSASSSLHKPPPLPPLSPPPWSTSSSAFDNAYAVSSVSAHTRSHTYSASVSVSMSMSVSDNSTLVSEPAYSRTQPQPLSFERSPSANRPTHAGASRSIPIPIPIPRRPPSPGETVSTSMVSFDRSDPDLDDPDLSEIASVEMPSEWEADTAESATPLARHPGGAR